LRHDAVEGEKTSDEVCAQWGTSERLLLASVQARWDCIGIPDHKSAVREGATNAVHEQQPEKNGQNERADKVGRAAIKEQRPDLSRQEENQACNGCCAR